MGFGRSPSRWATRSARLRIFSLITLKPASEKRAGKIGLYYIGNWPSARTSGGVKYQPPKGFIEVTQDRQNTLLSDHFRLRDFFPHDQARIWPKYIVVDMKLVDKLELILTELEKQGIPSAGVKVMSGFRTPQYNSGGGDTRGRASLSRHMYGDAAKSSSITTEMAPWTTSIRTER